MKCDEFRAGYLAGDTKSNHLDHCSECRAELPRLDHLRSMLASPELWEEPRGQIEDVIVSEINGQVETKPRRQWWMWAAAVVVLIAATASVTTLVLVGGAPDWEVIMVGTPNAPGASATVEGWNTEDGVRMELATTSLPAAPEGFYYELWLSAPDRIVSAGSFRQGQGVVLWSGVPRAVVPRLWVTLEAVDGNPAPSGQTVLDSG